MSVEESKFWSSGRNYLQTLGLAPVLQVCYRVPECDFLSGKPPFPMKRQ